MSTISPPIDLERNPLTDHLVLVEGVVTLKGQESLVAASADRNFLNTFDDCFCAYGACDCPIYPFTCSYEGLIPPTARQVLNSLRPRWFSSEHIESLDHSELPYAGYRPMTENDEIHTDSEGQAIFSKEVESSYTQKLHRELLAYVVNSRLFYVLLHDRPESQGEFEFSTWVTLFAVGISPSSNNLVGVVTHQSCHNFCD